MKLLIAFNLLDIERALSVARSVKEFADFFVIGPLLIYKYGVAAVERFKEAVPDIPLIVEAQLLERPQETVKLFSDAGASWITVMAGTDATIITTAGSTARQENSNILLDLADAISVGQSARDAKRFGASALSMHRSSSGDSRTTFLDQWEMVKGNTELPVFISANISRDNVGEILGLEPAGIIIGTSIIRAEDPIEEAKYFAELIKK